MMSPWYLKSEWCAKERQWWHEGTRALAPTIASGFDRAFIGRLMDSIEDEWPEIFKDTENIAKKGFWLYDRDKPKFQRVPWGSIGTEEDKAAYKQCVIEVAGQIGSRLEEIQARLEEDRKAKEALAKLQAEHGPDSLSLYARPDLRDPFDRRLRAPARRGLCRGADGADLAACATAGSTTIRPMSCAAPMPSSCSAPTILGSTRTSWWSARTVAGWRRRFRSSPCRARSTT